MTGMRKKIKGGGRGEKAAKIHILLDRIVKELNLFEKYGQKKCH